MLKNIFSKTIQHNFEGLTIKKLTERLGFSSRIKRSVKNPGNILVNSKNENINYVLKLGDLVELFIEDDSSENIVPQEMDLDIIYEDDFILLVNKPSGLVVHPTTYHFTDTLANGVVHYLQSKGEFCKFRPVNRLDRDTSGIILISKSQLAHSRLSKQMMEGKFKKEYQAAVHNGFASREGIINAPIARKPGSIMERMVDQSGQEAVTLYKVLSQNDFGAFLSIKLKTGRTHQIRVHFSHIGHSLFGDDLYGGSRELIDRQALHCCKLSFLHPQTNEKLEFKSNIPKDMQKLIQKIGLEILL